MKTSAVAAGAVAGSGIVGFTSTYIGGGIYGEGALRVLQGNNIFSQTALQEMLVTVNAGRIVVRSYRL